METQAPLNIVYVNPEIPQNTGSTARLCAAAGLPLHLVGRLGFRIDDRAVKRAGLDYWEHVTVHRHKDFNALKEYAPGARFLLFSKTASTLYSDAEYMPGDYLVFGAETKGLPPDIMETYKERCYRIPILPQVRSLNLATSTGIVVFEALRQLGFPHMMK
ncbi:MAG: tRNA (cytidine(34)-2'-O)-methyltransferase [bacterium]